MSFSARRDFLILPLALTMLTSAVAAAEPAEPPIAGSKLEDQPMDSWQRSPPGSWLHFFAFDDQWRGRPSFEIFGIVQPTFSTTSANNGDGFSFRRARLGLRGALSERISFFVMSEMAAGPVTATTSGGVRLLDAAVNWRLSRFAQVRAGQFLPSVSNILTPGAFVPWIDYSDIEKSIWLVNRQGDAFVSAGRDLGVAVWNEFRFGPTALTYEVGVFNGTGLAQREVDENAKEWTASLRLAHRDAWGAMGTWSGWRGVQGDDLFKLSGSVSAGWGNLVTDRLWLISELSATQEEQPAQASSVQSLGFYFALGARPYPRIGTTYRYAWCDCEDNIGPPGPRRSQVHSFIASYKIHKAIRLVAQYDLRIESNRMLVDGSADSFFLMLSVPLRYALAP